MEDKTRNGFVAKFKLNELKQLDETMDKFGNDSGSVAKFKFREMKRWRDREIEQELEWLRTLKSYVDWTSTLNQIPKPIDSTLVITQLTKGVKLSDLMTFQEMQRQYFIEVCKKASSNEEAIKTLGISTDLFYKMKKKFNLTSPHQKRSGDEI